MVRETGLISGVGQDIVNDDRHLKRLTDRLAKLDDTHLDAVPTKAEEMGRQLAAKREQLTHPGLGFDSLEPGR